MRKNIFLRISVLMLVATVAMSCVFVGSGTYAKYVASAQVQASARVAKFDVSIKVGGFKASDPNWPAAYSTWQQITQSDPTTPKALPEILYFTQDLYELTAKVNGDLQQAGGSYGTKAAPGTTPEPENKLNDGIVANANRVDVLPKDGSIIAPGTGGMFTLDFKNDSEVRVRIWLDSINAAVVYTNYAAGASPLPLNPSIETALLQFSVDNANWNTNIKTILTGNATTQPYIELAPNEEYSWTLGTTAVGSDATAKANHWKASTIYWRWRFETATPDASGIAPNDAADTALGVAAAAYASDVNRSQRVKMQLAVRVEQVD